MNPGRYQKIFPSGAKSKKCLHIPAYRCTVQATDGKGAFRIDSECPFSRIQPAGAIQAAGKKKVEGAPTPERGVPGRAEFLTGKEKSV
jgi:hypothetical protein